MTDATVGHGNWLAQAGMNHLSQLCASNAAARTSTTNNQSPDSGSTQYNQGQDQSAQSVRREEHATNSGGSSEPTKSKSGSDDEGIGGADSNAQSRGNSAGAGKKARNRSRNFTHVSEEPVTNGSTGNTKSGSIDGEDRATKIRKTTQAPAEQATNCGGSSDNTKSGSGDDECGGSYEGGSNNIGAAPAAAPAAMQALQALQGPIVDQGLIKLSSGSKSIEVDWVTLQKVILRLFTEDCSQPLNPSAAAPRPMPVPAADSSTSFKVDRTSSGDGYKWRKYGRKFLTFSRLNRDYYRCTHPGCPAKKHVEVIPDTGEVVTSGSTPHSHAPFAHAPGSSYKRGSPTEAPKKTSNTQISS